MLGTVYASPHDAFIIPELNLKGRVPSSYVHPFSPICIFFFISNSL